MEPLVSPRHIFFLFMIVGGSSQCLTHQPSMQYELPIKNYACDDKVWTCVTNLSEKEQSNQPWLTKESVTNQVFLEADTERMMLVEGLFGSNSFDVREKKAGCGIESSHTNMLT